MTRIFTLIGLAAAVFAVWWFFLRDKTADNTDESGTDDATAKWQPNCFDVPSNFPRYTTKPLPTETQTFLGFSATDWTTDLQDRVLGFFIAVDTEPSDYALKYFGKGKVLGYLNSPEGLFPSSIVLKGVMRCGSNRNRAGSKWSYTLV